MNELLRLFGYIILTLIGVALLSAGFGWVIDKIFDWFGRKR